MNNKLTLMLPLLLVACSTPKMPPPPVPKMGNITYIAENVIEITNGDENENFKFASIHCQKNGYAYSKLTRSYDKINYYSCMK